MIEQTEFTIESLPNKFRVGKLSALETLALQTQLNFSDMTKSLTAFTFVLEHTEVQVNNTWLPVKEPGREVYYPVAIENDPLAMKEIVVWFLANVIKPIFLKSNE